MRKKSPASSSAPELQIGERIRQAREKAKLSATELHKRTGISRAVLAKYESGAYKPGTAELRKLCDALRATPNELIYGYERPFRESTSDPFELLAKAESTGQSEIRDAIPGVMHFSMLMAGLAPDDRAALLLLARSLFTHTRGADALREVETNVIPGLSSAMSASVPEFDHAIDKLVDDPSVKDLGASMRKHQKKLRR